MFLGAVKLKILVGFKKEFQALANPEFKNQ